MDFFMKPIRQYMLERILSKNMKNLISHALFISGNILYSYIMKRINKYRIIKPVPVDVTKDYIDKVKN